MAYDPKARRERYEREKREKAMNQTNEPTENQPTATPATPIDAKALVANEPGPNQPPGETPAKPIDAGSLVEAGVAGPELPLGEAGPPPDVSEASPPKNKGGRPKGSKNRPKFEDVQQLAEPPKPPVDYAAMSGAVFDMATSTLCVAFGPEWQPRSPEERSMVCGSLQAYFQAKQVQDLPPGLMLTFVLTAYSVPRLKAPPTAGKLKLGWQWLRSKLRRKKPATVAIVPTNIEPSEQHEQSNGN